MAAREHSCAGAVAAQPEPRRRLARAGPRSTAAKASCRPPSSITRRCSSCGPGRAGRADRPRRPLPGDPRGGPGLALPARKACAVAAAAVPPPARPSWWRSPTSTWPRRSASWARANVRGLPPARCSSSTRPAIHSRLAIAKAERDRCDWDGWEATRAGWRRSTRPPSARRRPFLLNLYPLPAAVHRAVARAIFAALRGPRRGARRPPGAAAGGSQKPAADRLPVGRFPPPSGRPPLPRDFRGDGPPALRSLRLLLVPADDEVTAAVRAGCELFRDCARWSDRAIARQIRDDGVDILVDLTGYTTYSRPAILALRPAPLQMQHLGYVNTMAASFVDYQIADPHGGGAGAAGVLRRKLIFLPGCLFPVSPLGALGASAARPTRESEGLPADVPVFCSFNGPSKLDPPTWAAWMEILRRVPAAVLWLYDGDDPRLPANLRREAAAPGSARSGWFSPARRPIPTTSPATRWPTFSSTASPTTAAPPRSTPGAKACRCSPASAKTRSPGWAPASPPPPASPSWPPPDAAGYVELAARLGNDPAKPSRALSGRAAAERRPRPLRPRSLDARLRRRAVARRWEQAAAGELQDVSVGRGSLP